VGDHRARLFEQDPSDRRKRAAPLALEERRTNVVLKLLQGHRNGARRAADLAGRRAHAAGFADRDEAAHASQANRLAHCLARLNNRAKI
jgi:hypothetical protein